MLISGFLIAAAAAVAAYSEPAAPQDVNLPEYSMMAYAAFIDAIDCPANYETMLTNTRCHDDAANCAFLEHSILQREIKPNNNVKSQIIVNRDIQLIVVSIRVATSPWAFFLDKGFSTMSVPWLCPDCRVHTDIMLAFASILDQVLSSVQSLQHKNPTFRVVVTGHQLGGNVAVLIGAQLRRHGVFCDVYTYGSPRMGNEAFARAIEGQGKDKGETIRVTSRQDLVPSNPPRRFGFEHFWPEMWWGEGFARGWGKRPYRLCESSGQNGCNEGHPGFGPRRQTEGPSSWPDYWWPGDFRGSRFQTCHRSSHESCHRRLKETLEQRIPLQNDYWFPTQACPWSRRPAAKDLDDAWAFMMWMSDLEYNSVEEAAAKKAKATKEELEFITKLNHRLQKAGGKVDVKVVLKKPPPKTGWRGELEQFEKEAQRSWRDEAKGE